MSDRIKKLTKEMEEVMDAKRYTHTLGVAYTAAALAMCHGVDMKKAQVAGLLHDCAKCLTDEKRIEICEKNGLPISSVERRNPSLLHAKVGSFLAKTKYDVEDEEILGAICYHTTGRPNMNPLEKIIFIADYIEPGRDRAARLPEIRREAFVSLDETLRMILSDTLAYLDGKEKEGEIDPMTKETYEFYK